MSLYDPLGVLAGTPSYSPSAGMLQADSGVIYPGFKQKVLFVRGKYIVAVLFAAVIIFFIFSLAVFLFSLPSKSSAKNNTAATPAALVSQTGNPPPQELHVANNGLVLLRGARVLSASGTTLTLGMSWGSTTFTWVVRTAANRFGTHNYGTRFIDRSGNAITLDDITVGSFVTVTGMFDGNAEVPTVDADTVRSLH